MAFLSPVPFSGRPPRHLTPATTPPARRLAAYSSSTTTRACSSATSSICRFITWWPSCGVWTLSSLWASAPWLGPLPPTTGPSKSPPTSPPCRWRSPSCAPYGEKPLCPYQSWTLVGSVRPGLLLNRPILSWYCSLLFSLEIGLLSLSFALNERIVGVHMILGEKGQTTQNRWCWIGPPL